MFAFEGIKVIDLTRNAPGWICTMMLGDFGAEVIKVEPPTHVPDLLTKLDLSMIAETLNRNKKSMELNLRSEEGREVFYRLAKQADIIVEGFRPGVVQRLGIDYSKLSSLNPGLIYCSLSGYGQYGPYRELPGHDINYISFGGALGLIGDPDEPPVVPANLLADLAGAPFSGVIGILTALIVRNRTGLGQYIDIAYTDVVLSLLTQFAGAYLIGGKLIKRGETVFHGAYPYYRVYKTRDDKYLSLGCLEPWFWENLCRALRREEYIPYHTAPDHFFGKSKDVKWSEISCDLERIFLTKPRDEWFQFLSSKDVPVAKVYDLSEVFDDPQLLARDMVVKIEHSKLGKIKEVGIAIKLSATPGGVRTPAPARGEHTTEILLQLGYNEEDVQAFRNSGIV